MAPDGGRMNANPFVDIPPDWVALSEVFPTLSRRFKADFTNQAQELVSALRSGDLDHRVDGLGLEDVLRLSDVTFGRRLIPGLGWESGAVIVVNWQDADVHWPTGTVGGKLRQGVRMRHKIEIRWLDLERWAKERLPGVDPPAVQTTPRPQSASLTRSPVPPPHSHDAKIQPIYSTGAPGKPTSRHLVAQELKRREEAEETCDSQTKEAEVLAAWLKATHPLAPPMGGKAIQNSLRSELKHALNRTRPN
jgi:hypothetical protein